MEQIDYSNTSKELDSWFGLQSPTFMIITLGIYLLIVLKVGPEYMKNRKAYKLKTFISIYNVIQVLACIYIVQEILSIASTNVFKFWKCSIFNQNTRSEYFFNRVTYFTFWLKVVELTETVVFVLRKKQNQVSFLHVFHHCSTITLVYLLLKYYRGGSSLYPLLLNCTVHIVMYSYYLVAAVGDKELIQRLTPIKKSITTIQMIQFCLILLQAFTMWSLCEIPTILVSYYCGVVGVIFYGFYDFYKQAYTPKRKLSS